MTNDTVIIRPLNVADVPKLTKYANNLKVAINLRDAFPNPYTKKDAEQFIKMANEQNPTMVFAVEYKGGYVGNIGLVLCADVYRQSAEIGYFLGEPFWGRGIASRAVNLITEYGFNTLGVIRIHTGVFEFNKASQRVLEKCGYTCEGVFKKAITKNGKVHNEVRYARIKNTDND